MIIFVPLLVFIALVIRLKLLSWKLFSKYALLASIPFFLIVGANIAYRWHVENKIAIFGEFRHATPGLTKWTQTWLGPQTVKENIVWGPFLISVNDFQNLPYDAFSSDEERSLINQIVKEVKVRGYMLFAEDSFFMKVANERIEKILWLTTYGIDYIT